LDGVVAGRRQRRVLVSFQLHWLVRSGSGEDEKGIHQIWYCNYLLRSFPVNKAKLGCDFYSSTVTKKERDAGCKLISLQGTKAKQ
jgi:hypothetical protein